MAEEYLQLKADAICDVVEAAFKDATGLNHLKAGYTRFLAGLDSRTGRSHTWSFLKPLSTITIWPTIAVGTATVTGVKDNGTTTVTASEDTFYPLMVGSTITITAVGDFVIASYTSATVVVVTGDATGAGKTFSIACDGTYALPDDFGGLLEPFTYDYHASYSTPRLEEVSVETIFARWRNSETEGTAWQWAILPVELDKTVGQLWKVIFAPVTQYARTLKYRYLKTPIDITDGTVYLVGGTLHSYTIQELALADAELTLAGVDGGPHETRAAQLLAASIDKDKLLFETNDIQYLAQR